MAMGMARWETATGGVRERFFDGGDHVASQIGNSLDVGTWNGISGNLVFRKNFGWHPAAAIPAGCRYTYTTEAVNSVGMVILSQSNPEGRELISLAPPVVNSEHIAPNSYPYDENFGGLAGEGYGPAIVLGDLILSDPATTHNRVTIYSTGTGNRSVAQLYGTDGTDGNYATQMQDVDVLGGPEGATTPPLLYPATDYFILHGQGEADAGAGLQTPQATWVSRTESWLAHVVNNDFPSSNCIGIIVLQFGPSAPDDLIPSVSHPNWSLIGGGQGLIQSPSASIPIIRVPYLDSDRIADDKIHISNWERICADALVRMKAANFAL